MKLSEIYKILGPRDTLTLKGVSPYQEEELNLTGKKLLNLGGEASSGSVIPLPHRSDWTARYQKARVVRKHETFLEVDVFNVRMTAGKEAEELEKTVHLSI